MIIFSLIHSLSYLTTRLWSQLLKWRTLWPSHRYHEVMGSNPVNVLSFSGFYIRNCINCVHNCEDHSSLDFTSAVLYMKHFIYHLTFIPDGLIRINKWSAPNVSGLIAHLVRASHRYRIVYWYCIAHLISHPQFYIWNISYITWRSFLTGSLESTNDQLPTSVAS